MLPGRYSVATIDSAENKRIGSGGKFLFSLDITFQLAKQTFIRYKQAFIRYKYVFIRTNKPALESRKMLRNIKKIYFVSCMAFIFLFIHLFTRRTFRQL